MWQHQHFKRLVIVRFRRRCSLVRLKKIQTRMSEISCSVYMFFVNVPVQTRDITEANKLSISLLFEVKYWGK